MKRDTLDFTLIIVTDRNGNEVEIKPDDMLGNLNEEASQSLMIGRAVRNALMQSCEDCIIEVSIYAQ